MRKIRTAAEQGSSLLWSILIVPVLLAMGVAQANAVDQQGQVQLNITILPTATLTFLDTPLLYLEVPPPGSTIPANGVRFRVTGNAMAILTAEPDAFIQIPSEGNNYLGKAVLNGNAVGYKIELRFPSIGVLGSNPQYAALPGYEAGATVPPLAVNLTLTGGVRDGVVHLEASPDWTADGGLPLPGIYVGNVILTLTADNL